VDFGFSEEQEEFRATLRRFFEEKAPSAELRRVMETEDGFDRVVWKQMGEELGLQGVHIPEAYGGQGFGFLELGIVLEEMGRLLFPTPYLASVGFAANLILRAGDEAQKQALLPGIASGETIATLALLEENPGAGTGSIAVQAEPEGDGYLLSGEKRHVVDAAVADLILVAARLPGSEGSDGITLVAVRGDDPGVTLTPVDVMDPVRKQCHVRFEGARGTLLGTEGGGYAPLGEALHLAAIALSAEMLGGAERCLEMAVDYAKVRVQFGRAIGSFQAIKHKAADVLLDLESARSVTHWAFWVADENGAELAEAAHIAKATCTDVYLHASRENLQIHGGIGYTWEHDVQLYFKRAKSSEVLLGDAVRHRAALAATLGL